MGVALYGRLAAGSLRRRPRELSDRVLERSGVTVDRERLAAYDRVCGFRVGDRLPATYPHVLAFPLAMELMAAGDFPFPALGLVHVANAIEQLRPLDAAEPLDLRVWAERLADHPRGRTVDVVADAAVDGEVVWRDRSTYLRRGGGGGGGRAGGDPAGHHAAEAAWRVPGDIGRRYAAVSGDRNPIHLHGLTARALGQPGAIAHGMWTKARCLAALEPTLPDAFTAEIAFKLPIRLPATVAFASWPEEGGRRFAVRDARSGKPHAAGAVSPGAA